VEPAYDQRSRQDEAGADLDPRPAKDAKGEERCGLGGPCHIAQPDIGRGRDALRRGMSKKRATAIFDLPLRVGPVVP
jgi:hypothetical protein